MLIIATIGRSASNSAPSMVRAGADILRFNGTRSEISHTVSQISLTHAELRRAGLTSPIFVDIGSGKLRLGELKHGGRQIFKDEVHDFCCSERGEVFDGIISIRALSLPGIAAGDTLIIGDGELAFKVIDVVDARCFRAKALNNGAVGSTRGVTIAGKPLHCCAMGESMETQLAAIAPLRPEWVGISFSEKREQVQEVSDYIKNLNSEWRPKIAVKIESYLGICNARDLANCADMVIIARGDLAINTPFHLIGIYQDHLIDICRTERKRVVVATEIFGNSIERYIPHRSGITEITRLMSNGSGILFGSETSGGSSRAIAVTRSIEAEFGELEMQGRHRLLIPRLPNQ